MAIRFRPDNNNSGGGGNFSNNRGGGGGNGRMLMALVGFAMRYPKFTIPILIVGVVLYFIGGLGGGSSSANKQENIYNMGCQIDQEKYDATQVYAALASSSDKYTLPKKVSLRRFTPTPQNQGEQGSCVGWSSAYAARTTLEAVSTGANPNSITFSPSFLYNQIGLRGCQGAYTGQALEHMTQHGLLYFAKFPYDPNSCTNLPSRGQLEEAKRYRIRGYNRLTKTGRNYDVDLEAVKQNIAQGAPVIIAAKVPYSFQDMMGKRIWRPTAAEARSVNNHGGHAMCLIGYDDEKQLFEIMNSWGTAWGDNGYVFVSYKDFKVFCREAYGVFPEPKANSEAATDFAISCGLYDVATKNNINLRRVRGNLFETTQAVKKGTELKIEITNSIECFTYVYSKEADEGGRQGSALTVFPPSNKYSSYLGILGTRLFPRDGIGKFYADNEGNRDHMAIIYSKEELNTEQLRKAIDQAGQGNFYDNVMAAVGNFAFKNLNYSSTEGRTISFKQRASAKEKIAVVVIAMDKK